MVIVPSDKYLINIYKLFAMQRQVWVKGIIARQMETSEDKRHWDGL